MSRTLSGNLTGAAARTHWTDIREQIEDEARERRAAKRQAQFMDVMHEIRDTMTQDEYIAWWEAAPEDGFKSYAEDYLLAIKLCDRIVAETQDEMETMLVMIGGILKGDGTLPLDDEYEMIFSGGEVLDRNHISQEVVF